MNRPLELAAAKLRERTEPGPGGCILWTGLKDRWGYGRTRFRRRKEGAHRVAWVVANGEIPDGMHVLHSCDVPACVNVAHLRLGTHAENMAEMTTKGRRQTGKSSSYQLTGRCIRGHDPAGITYRKNGKGHMVRSCKECDRTRRKPPPDAGRCEACAGTGTDYYDLPSTKWRDCPACGGSGGAEGGR